MPIISGMTYKGHNADGLLTAQCGCCPGATDCLGFYQCTQGQRREELKQCAKAAGEPTARPTLAGQTFEGHDADGLLEAVCGCICPEDDCAGLYPCTQGERAAQLAQCPMPAPAPETVVEAITSTIKETVESTGLPVNPINRLPTSVCGCICEHDTCMALYPCTPVEHEIELKRCSAGETRRLGEDRLN